jgi:Caspase domain
MKRLIFILLSLFFSFSAFSQNKHALLVGINDYYEIFGVKSEESLRGPVNDVRAIKDLLVRKFGFPLKNIDTIMNGAATRDNIIAGMLKKLKDCKPGDVMVFYYSGHGVWLQNTNEFFNRDKEKRGMNQAILTSDLYSFSDNYKCFLRDVTLKQYFNKFIDKNVVFTSLIDCCFGGKLAMVDPNARPEDYIREKAIDLYDLMGRLTENAPDSKKLTDSITAIPHITPPGCKTDSAGNLLEFTDEDADGVPDCADYEPKTPRDCMPVNRQGIGSCPFEYGVQYALNRFDEKEIATRGSFDGKRIVRISEADNVARPADRPNSRFLFFSATNDAQKALEFPNQKKVIHGMFTAAILRVFEANPANTPMEVLLQKVKADMDRFKKDQTPMLYGDPARMKQNLIGTLR